MFAKYFLAGFIAVISVSSLASAQATNMANAPTDGKWLTGDEIMKEYTNTTQTGMYSWTRNNSNVPVSFTETHNDNTITTYNEYSKDDFTVKGVWIVKKNIICYYYSDWRMQGEHCFKVLKSGNCYYHYGRNHPGTFENLDAWNSVGYDEDETPTCVPPIS